MHCSTTALECSSCGTLSISWDGAVCSSCSVASSLCEAEWRTATTAAAAVVVVSVSGATACAGQLHKVNSLEALCEVTLRGC
eukprot:19351-Heterococcus_DN1.PRE.1